MVNAKKTQQMTISRKTIKDNNSIEFLGESLKIDDSVKLLGVNITKTLDWNYHVNKFATNSGRLLGILRKAKQLLPSIAHAKLFKTKIRSTMEQCSPT